VQRVQVAVEASDPITIAGLTAQLNSRPEIKTVTGCDAAEVDVLVLCVDAVNAEVIRRLRALVATSPTRTILVAREVRPEDALSLVECRVVAVLPRPHATQERLIRVVLGARAGHGTLPPDLLGALLQQVAELQQLAPTLGLTPSGLADRERDVLRLVADGFNTAEIAEKLSYSERTVKSTLYTVLSRLRVRNRSHAVAAAIRAGVI
jgi:DNA-binding NarL/FixJ family response regulator